MAWLPRLLGLVLLLPVAQALADELTYESDIRPILKAHCFHCHRERGKLEGKLDLRLRRLIVQGGETGPAMVPGNAPDSLLIQRLQRGEMPPGDDKRLAPAEIDKLTRWIQAGAPTVRPEPASVAADRYFTDEERNWWAFRPLKKLLPPRDRRRTRAGGGEKAWTADRGGGMAGR